MNRVRFWFGAWILAQKRGFQEPTQFLLPERFNCHPARIRLVLTEKTGLFSGVLAAKSMFLEIKMLLCF